MKHITKYLPHIIAALFLVGFVAWAWTEPSSLPPAGNVEAPINVGATDQSKLGGFGLGGGVGQALQWLKNVGGTLRIQSQGGTPNLVIGQDGNVGIGTINPQAKLDVQGAIKVGSFAFPPTCDINAVGSLIYDTTKNRLFVCRTSGWKAIALGVDADGDGFLAGEDDCYDLNAQTFPGQTEWFSVNRGDGNFDYNCSGAIETLYGNNLVNWALCDVTGAGAGWEGTVPGCGGSGTYRYGGWCSWSESRTQQCH